MKKKKRKVKEFVLTKSSIETSFKGLITTLSSTSGSSFPDFQNRKALTEPELKNKNRNEKDFVFEQSSFKT